VDKLSFSEEELAEAAALVSQVLPGVYTAKQVYGPRWKEKESPTDFGLRLKAAVEAGHLTGIEVHPQKTGSNAIRYIVRGG